MIRMIMALLGAVLGLAGVQAQAGERPLSSGYGTLDVILDEAGVEGAILVRRVSDGAEWTGGGARVDQRFLPASTFKIPNSLIILQSGVVSDVDTGLLEWDGVERSPGWDRDMSLRMGFRRSAVWAYQEWARRVGHDRMSAHVAAIGYGNGDIGGPENVDLFWLEGPLKISAREQVDFLQRLHERSLPFDAGIQERVVDIMERDRAEDGSWVLRAKTGWAIRREPNIGWFTGWLESESETWLFAVNIDMIEPGSRRELAEAALRRIGAYPG